MTAIDIPGSINRGGPHLFSSGNLVGNGQRIQYVYVKLKCLYTYIHILYRIHKNFRFRFGDQLPSLPSGRMSRLLSLKHVPSAFCSCNAGWKSEWFCLLSNFKIQQCDGMYCKSVKAYIPFWFPSFSLRLVDSHGPQADWEWTGLMFVAKATTELGNLTMCQDLDWKRYTVPKDLSG